MSIFRSYFKKNSTLIDGVTSNNSRNPVTEISYGTVNGQVSRYIFDIDLLPIQSKLTNEGILENSIVKHVLHMTNTIRVNPELVGKKSYNNSIDRANSFELELFNVNEDWDEGAGYTFSYTDSTFPILDSKPSNWKERKTNTNWGIAGGNYSTGSTNILGSQSFDNGNENIEIDITDYINQRLYLSGNTFTGTSYGIGIKFYDIYEKLLTISRQAVAFHAKNTNTYYEPYIETIIEDTIIDDRNHFFLDKDNYLYLYPSIDNNQQNITINQVQIFDYNDSLILTVSGSSIIKVKKGVYKIMLNISSSEYPDAVIFRDEWTVTINGKVFVISNQFYLISQENYYSFDLSNQINLDNYYFTFYGICENEKLLGGVNRKIKVLLRELYSNQNNSIPLDIEYRIFTSVADKYEINIIPFTKMDRTNRGYEFNLDTSWLLPQDYKMQIRVNNGSFYETKQTLSFSVVSENII